MKGKKITWFSFLSASAVIIILMYLLNSLTPMHFDDFIYINSFATGERITSISQIFPSMMAHYKTFNGRLLLHFLAQCFLMLDPNVFDFINSIAFFVLILVIYYHSTGSFRNINSKFLILIFSVLWVASPAFGESFLWLVGSSNYLYGILLFLVCLIPYRFFFKEYKKLSFLQNVILSLTALICGVVGSYTNENLSVAFFVVQICYIAAYLLNNYKFRIWMPFMFVGNIIGTVFLFSSPTYKEKSDIWQSSFFSKIITAIKNIPYVTVAMARYIWVAIILTIVCFTIFICTKENKTFKSFLENNKKQLSLFAVYLITFFVWIYASCLCDYFPQRAYCHGVVILIIVSIGLIHKIKFEKFNNIIINISAFLITVVFLLGSYLPGYFDVKSAKYQYDRRLEIIEQAHSENKTTVELSPIKCETKYSLYFYGGDIAPNENWLNNLQATYYGFDEIIVKSDD